MALMEMKDGQPIPTTNVHFGYTDGISMTTVRGGPEHYPSDHQQPSNRGSLCCSTKLRTTSCPNPNNLDSMAALPSSR